MMTASELAAVLDEIDRENARREPPLPLVWQCYPTTFRMFESERPWHFEQEDT